MIDERSEERAQRVSLAEDALARSGRPRPSEGQQLPSLLLETSTVKRGAGPLGRKGVCVALQRHGEIAELSAAHLCHDATEIWFALRVDFSQ